MGSNNLNSNCAQKLLLSQMLVKSILHHHNYPGQVQPANQWPTFRVNPAGLNPPLYEIIVLISGLLWNKYQNCVTVLPEVKF
jgi:hypothetical protein